MTATSLPKLLLVFIAASLLAACSGGGEVPLGGNLPDDPVEDPTAPPVAGVISPGLVPYGLSQLFLRWQNDTSAQWYNVWRQDRAGTPFTKINSENIIWSGSGFVTYADQLPVHITNWPELAYRLETCNSAGCSCFVNDCSQPGLVSGVGQADYRPGRDPTIGDKTVGVSVPELGIVAGANIGVVGYGKVSDPISGLQLGWIVALSADGTTLALGSNFADDTFAQTGIPAPGAVYVFRIGDVGWVQEAKLVADPPPGVARDLFGSALSLSADGNTLVVGAPDAGLSSQSAVTRAGRVHVFHREGTTWTQQSAWQAPNAVVDVHFGNAVAISGDGTVIAVGSAQEGSNTTGVGATPTAYACPGANCAAASGAVYVYALDDDTWSLEAYVKPRNTKAGSGFGKSVSLSDDGATLAVGAALEDSGVIHGFNPALPYTLNAVVSGPTTLYRAVEAVPGGSASAPPNADFWVATAPPNYDPTISYEAGTLVRSGDTLYRAIDLVPADPENTNAPPNDTWWTPAPIAPFDPTAGYEADAVVQVDVYRAITAVPAGAANAPPHASYWTATGLHAYDPASAYEPGALVHAGGLVYRAIAAAPAGATPPDTQYWAPAGDDCSAEAAQRFNCTTDSGAAYVFTRAATGDEPAWTQTAFIKASNAGPADQFGDAIALSADDSTLLVGAPHEASGKRFLSDFTWSDLAGDDPANATSPQNDRRSPGAGAAYLFHRDGANWTQDAYLKAHNTIVINTGGADEFGSSVALSGDGKIVAVGAPKESSRDRGINTVRFTDNTTSATSDDFGAAYVYVPDEQEFFFMKDTRNAGVVHSQNGRYGLGVALSRDGSTFAVGAPGDDCGNPALAGVHNTYPISAQTPFFPDIPICAGAGLTEDSGAVYVY